VTLTNEVKHIYSELVIKRDTGFNITALTGFVHDVTESKATQQRLEESELKYRYLFAHSPQPAWVFDVDTFRFLDVNDAAINYYGYSYEEFRNMTAFDIRPESEKTQFTAVVIEDIKNNTTRKATWTHVKKDGTLVKAEILSANVVHDGRPARLVLLTNLFPSLVAASPSLL
jgi:PAS domain S-box-containing protein